jgi:glucose/arabinose dehydrogenase
MNRWMAVVAMTGLLAPTTQAREAYADASGECDGLPRLHIGTAAGMCAGLVMGPTKTRPARPITLPRSLLQLSETEWLVSDLGAWDRPRGAVWKLTLRPGQEPSLSRLLSGLQVPHALARGADGLVYVGEMSRIIRFDPASADPQASVEVVIAGLPENALHLHRHPLSKFVFAPDGALLVNVGALSDQCEGARDRTSGGSCLESESGEHAASLRRYAPIGPGEWSQDYTVYAKGLRNSVALAVHASGTVVQAENSYDLPARWSPFEELNVIEEGRHYGWPYCMDLDTPAPAWRPGSAMDCKGAAHARPRILLPPHAAPLDLLWYQGSMFPALRGRMLMTFHGHRSVGGRIVSFAVDDSGVPIADRNARYPSSGGGTRAFGAAPAATPVTLTPGWGRLPGLRPQGSPVGLAVARDGAIWATDDRAGLIIRFAKEQAPQAGWASPTQAP